MIDKYKALVIPFVALIALLSQMIFKITIGTDVQSQIAQAIYDVFAVIAVVYGIYNNGVKHDPPVDPPVTQ